MFGINEEQTELRNFILAQKKESELKTRKKISVPQIFENELPEALLRQVDKNDDFPGVHDFMKTMGKMGLNGPGIVGSRISTRSLLDSDLALHAYSLHLAQSDAHTLFI
jgi:hypothetical protein